MIDLKGIIIDQLCKNESNHTVKISLYIENYIYVIVL